MSIDWSTIIIAVLSSLTTAAVAILPGWVKTRSDKIKLEAEADAIRKKADIDAAKANSEITDTARRAAIEIISALTSRVDALDADLQRVLKELAEERDKRRAAESRVITLGDELADSRVKAHDQSVQYESRISTLESELAEARTKIDRLTTQVKQLERRGTGPLPELKKA